MNDKIHIALDIMSSAHQGKTRDYKSSPYQDHCIRVGFGVAASKSYSSIDNICIALLHDVKEDKPEYFPVIQKMLGDVIANGVSLLTNPSKGMKLPRERRKEIDRKHLAKLADDLKFIKLVDRSDNVSELIGDVEAGLAPKDFGLLYAKETELLVREIVEEICSPDISEYELKLIHLVNELEKVSV